MSPSTSTVLILFGLVASIRAIPAPLPNPEIQVGLANVPNEQDNVERDAQVKPTNVISLGHPTYWVSWDAIQPPKPTKPSKPTKKTSTKGHISATISWGKRQIIPSASVSWDGSEPPKPTKFPWPWWPPRPQPSGSTSNNGEISATITWDKRQLAPTASVSWDGPQVPQPPKPTKFPWPWWPSKPQPSEATSNNGEISATITWNKRQDDVPEPTDFPEFPEDPDFPDNPDFPDDPFPVPTPSDQITFLPPTASISWGKRQEWTKPSGYLSWGKRQEDEPEPTDVPEDPDFPDDSDFPDDPFPVPTPSDQITFLPPTASVSWGKRQDEPEPTDLPEDPEDPPSPPTPSDQVTFLPPTASITWGKRQEWTKPSGYISWGKRQEDEPEPTDFPEDPFPEDPEDPEDPPSPPTPSDQITFLPPTATISWGKRQEAPEPTGYLSWGKRQEWTKPSGYISWGKRQEDEPEPTDFPEDPFPEDPFPEDPFPEDPIPEDPEDPDIPPAPTPSDQITLLPPSATISWGKRNADGSVPLPPTRPAPPPPPPTVKPPPSLTTISEPVPQSSACPTATVTVSPPCIPPICPHNHVSCKVVAFGQFEAVDVKEVQMTIVTMTTIVKPTELPTLKPTQSKCSTVTKTVYLPCPTYTCIPGNDCGLSA